MATARDSQFFSFNPKDMNDQEKAYRDWCNYHLRGKKIQIADLATDFMSGVKLLMLLEGLSGHSFEPQEPSCNANTGALEARRNVQVGFDFLCEQGFKLVSITPFGIVEGNKDMTLALLWNIIYRAATEIICSKTQYKISASVKWCSLSKEEAEKVRDPILPENLVSFSSKPAENSVSEYKRLSPFILKERSTPLPEIIHIPLWANKVLSLHFADQSDVVNLLENILTMCLHQQEQLSKMVDSFRMFTEGYVSSPIVPSALCPMIFGRRMEDESMLEVVISSTEPSEESSCREAWDFLKIKHIELSERMNCHTILVDQLWEVQVFNDYERDDILNIRHNILRSKKLLQLVRQKGLRASLELYKALEKQDPYLMEDLKTIHKAQLPL